MTTLSKFPRIGMAGLLLVLAGAGCAADGPGDVSSSVEALVNSSGKYVATAEAANTTGTNTLNTYTATQDLGGTEEQIGETLSSSVQRMSWRWTLAGLPSTTGTWAFEIVARRLLSTGDNFTFYWSTSSTGPWTSAICTLTSTDTTNKYCSLSFTKTTATTLYVQVNDSIVSADTTQDKIAVDSIEVSAVRLTRPLAPSNTAALPTPKICQWNTFTRTGPSAGGAVSYDCTACTNYTTWCKTANPYGGNDLIQFTFGGLGGYLRLTPGTGARMAFYNPGSAADMEGCIEPYKFPGYVGPDDYSYTSNPALSASTTGAYGIPFGYWLANPPLATQLATQYNITVVSVAYLPGFHTSWMYDAGLYCTGWSTRTADTQESGGLHNLSGRVVSLIKWVHDNLSTGRDFQVVAVGAGGIPVMAGLLWNDPGATGHSVVNDFVNQITFMDGPVGWDWTAACSSPTQGFKVTPLYYAETTNLNTNCATAFGTGWRAADWTEVEAYYNAGGHTEGLFRDAGHANNGDQVMVKNGGADFWSGGRHYFIERHDHVNPGYFLSHDNIDNHLLDLGSWYGLNMRVMCTNTALNNWTGVCENNPATSCTINSQCGTGNRCETSYKAASPILNGCRMQLDYNAVRFDLPCFCAGLYDPQQNGPALCPGAGCPAFCTSRYADQNAEDFLAYWSYSPLYSTVFTSHTTPVKFMEASHDNNTSLCAGVDGSFAAHYTPPTDYCFAHDGQYGQPNEPCVPNRAGDMLDPCVLAHGGLINQNGNPGPGHGWHCYPNPANPAIGVCQPCWYFQLCMWMDNTGMGTTGQAGQAYNLIRNGGPTSWTEYANIFFSQVTGELWPGSASSQFATVALDIAKAPVPTCGNSTVQSPEQCDGGECCSAACTYKVTGSACGQGGTCTSGLCSSCSWTDKYGTHWGTWHTCYDKYNQPYQCCY